MGQRYRGDAIAGKPGSHRFLVVQEPTVRHTDLQLKIKSGCDVNLSVGDTCFITSGYFKRLINYMTSVISVGAKAKLINECSVA